MFAPSVDTRTDWFRLLVQLKDEGYSLYSVAHFTGIPKSTLIGYKQGSEPRYNDGRRLVEFWAQTTGKQPADAPVVNPFSYRA